MAKTKRPDYIPADDLLPILRDLRRYFAAVPPGPGELDEIATKLTEDLGELLAIYD